MSADNALVTPQVFSLPRLSDYHAQSRAQQQPQKIPVSVTKIMGELVQVKIEAKGRGTAYTIPEIVVPQTYSQWAREPTQVGDKGFIVSSDYYLGGMSGIGGGTANYYDRANLTNMVFQPISQKTFPANTNRNLNQYFINGPQGVHLQTTSGGSAIDIGTSSITFTVGSTVVTIEAGSVTITVGGNTHTFTGALFKSAGDVTNSVNTSLTTHVHAGGPPPTPGS